MRLREEAKDGDEFLRFVNAIINDMIYLLDEALIKAEAVKDLQAIQDDLALFRRLNVSQRALHQQRMSENLHQLRTASILGTSTIQLIMAMIDISEVLQIFTRSEMVERVAQLINYYVNKLSGPERRRISIRAGFKLNFKPDVWLAQFIRMYVRFQESEEFVRAVVSDGRSFSMEMLEGASVTLDAESKRSKSENNLVNIVYYAVV